MLPQLDVSLKSTIASEKQSERLYALDAIRALALLIGVVFHGVASLVSYIPPMSWAVRDTAGNAWLDGFFYVAHIFRMPVFFLIAGLFAHLLYHRQGARGFLRHRFKRLVLPLLLFWPFIHMSLVMLWVRGYQQMGYFAHMPQTAHLRYWQLAIGGLISPEQFKNGFPWGHLWFLYVLSLFCGGVWLLRPLLGSWLDRTGRLRAGLDRGLAFVMQHWWGSLVLGLVTIGPMQGITGPLGVDTPDNGFLPGISFLLYGLYFSLGWLLHRQPQLLRRFQQYWQPNLRLSIGLIVGLMLLYSSAGQALFTPSPLLLSKFFVALYKGVYGIAAMTSVFAFMGLGMQYLSNPSPHMRYLSDASYWVYLVHLPVVVIFQILVAPYAWTWPIKVAAILLPSLVLLGLSYQYGVRNTWLGALLNGRRKTE